MITEIDNRAKMMPKILEEKYPYLWGVYKMRLDEELIDDWDRGIGFYIPRLRFKGNDHWKIAKAKIDNKSAIFKLIDYQFSSNPNDMVNWSKWELVGFEGKKPIRECNFLEFKEIYASVFTK